MNAGPEHLSWIEIGEEPTNLEEGIPDAQLFSMRITNEHFEDIIHFLKKETSLEGYFFHQNKELVVQAEYFSVIVGHLYKMGIDEILRRYVHELEQSRILEDAHADTTRGHYVGRETAQKILHIGLW